MHSRSSVQEGTNVMTELPKFPIESYPYVPDQHQLVVTWTTVKTFISNIELYQEGFASKRSFLV